MFFVLSKVLYFLLMPAWWVVFLLVWRYFAKRPVVKRRLLIAAIAVLVVFSNQLIFRTITMAWQPEPATLPAGKTYDAAIVLGGLSGYDRYGRGHFADGADRFIQTANLYHRGIVKKVIISGGSGLLQRDAKPEAIFLREQFLDNGIPDSAIVSECASRNTFENAMYARKLVDSLHLRSPLLLVTSATHMPRSMEVFRKAGFDCIAYPCDYKTTRLWFSLSDIFPNPEVMVKWTFLLKEMVGLQVYKLTGKA